MPMHEVYKQGGMYDIDSKESMLVLSRTKPIIHFWSI
jgi:hypothetical protein